MLYSLAATPSNLAFNAVTTGDNTVYCSGGTPTVQPASYRCPGATGTTGRLRFPSFYQRRNHGLQPRCRPRLRQREQSCDCMVASGNPAGLLGFAQHLGADRLAGSLAPTATSYQVTQGGSIDATVTVALVGGFTGPVSFSCTDTASESTCTAPNPINATSNVSFHIMTSAPTVATRSTSGHGTQIFYALLLPGLFGVVVAAGPRRSLRGMRFLGLITILGLSTMWLASCGGGSGGSKSPGTAKGSYTITVSGTSGSTTVPASFQLVVQ